MSEWTRNGRDQDGRQQSESGDWQRREGGWRGGRSADDQEERSFGQSSGGYGERNYASQTGGYSGQGGGYGGSERGWQGGRYQGGGSQYGGGSYGQGGQRYGSQGYGGERGQRYGGQQGYGQGYGGSAQRNSAVERVTDGDEDRGAFGMFGRGDRDRGGEHRGRGPKNYTRSDDRIREDVNDRLSDDSWLDASEIEVQVSSCEVSLTGTVNSREDKRRAEDLAEQVSGVKHVQNNLRVQQASAGSFGASTGQTQPGATSSQGSTAGQSRSSQTTQ